MVVVAKIVGAAIVGLEKWNVSSGQQVRWANHTDRDAPLMADEDCASCGVTPREFEWMDIVASYRKSIDDEDRGEYDYIVRACQVLRNANEEAAGEHINDGRGGVFHDSSSGYDMYIQELAKN